VLFAEAPEYERAIEAGKDARRLWFALRDWQGQIRKATLGTWGLGAEDRFKELGLN